DETLICDEIVSTLECEAVASRCIGVFAHIRHTVAYLAPHRRPMLSSKALARPSLVKEILIVTERVTLITGASAGIGAELARVFAAHGHRVALIARRADRLAAIADEITKAGGKAPILIPCD